jgi:hypothetical protein
VRPDSGVVRWLWVLIAIVNGVSLPHQNPIVRFGKPITPAAQSTLLAITSRSAVYSASA